MCKYSGKLIAWLDHELDSVSMAEIAQHLTLCGECKNQVELFEQTSKTINAYYDALVAATERRRIPGRPGMLVAAGIAAIAASVFFFLPRTRVAPPAVTSSLPTSPAVVVTESPLVPAKTTHRQHERPQMQNSDSSSQLAEPAIEIAIPAESMFAPGAIPEGVSFTADLSLRADGSAKQIRLQPRLIGFEGRTTQP
jgi:hypothetical protein